MIKKCYFIIIMKINYIIKSENIRQSVGSQVKESDRIQSADKIRSDSGLWTDIRIPSVGIRWVSDRIRLSN